MSLPNVFKVKLPEIHTTDVDRMYNFFFDVNCFGWAGRIGHYAWHDDMSRVAQNQDGYIYAWKKVYSEYKFTYEISADPSAYKLYYPKIKNEDVEEILVDNYL